MALRIDPDHRRFRDIVRGKIKQDLRKYISQGEMIGRKGKDLVSIPLPQIDIPRFRFGSKRPGGVGQGDGEPGDALGKGEPSSAATGQGRRPGRASTSLEVELSLEELAQILGEELQLPRIEPKGKQNDHHAEGPVHRHPARRPGVAAPLQAHLPAGAASGRSRPAPTTREPDDRPGPRGQALPLVEDRAVPQSNAVIIYMMDVSGSMGDEQKEIVRIESFWIDTWLRTQYKGLEIALHHPRRDGQGGRPRHLLPHPRVGRHDDLQRLQAVRAR